MNMLACAPVVVRKTLPSPIVSVEEQHIDPALLREVLGERDGDPYRVGPGDRLLVVAYGHPELSLASSAGIQTAGKPVGLLVDNDGTTQLPLIGTTKVAGKTLEELRAYLHRELSVFLKDPKVTVQLLEFGSIRYYMLGQFNSPGMKISDRPLRLLEALAVGGGVRMDAASLRGSYVARNGKRLPVNFRRLMREGDMQQNIRMRTGDVIMVPDNQVEQAFVFAGSPGSAARGGAVPFRNGRLNLLQALAQAGYGFRERAQGRLSETRVIRSDGDRGELFVINAKKIMNGEAAPFELAPGDVVFVPPRGMTSWNQALDQLLPSLQVIAGLLNPFVQIQYLRESLNN